MTPAACFFHLLFTFFRSEFWHFEEETKHIYFVVCKCLLFLITNEGDSGLSDTLKCIYASTPTGELRTLCQVLIATVICFALQYFPDIQEIVLVNTFTVFKKF